MAGSRRPRAVVPSFPGSGLLVAGSKRAGSLAGQFVLRRSGVRAGPDFPVPRATVGLVAQVVIDETLVRTMAGRGRRPSEADGERAVAELSAARDLYRSRGWLAEPRSYHRTPPTPRALVSRRRSARGLAYDAVMWESGFTPYDEEPGAERWEAFRANAFAHAYVVRAPVPTDRWLVCVHGFGMGTPQIDMHIFRAKRLAAESGCNLAFPVLPLHGPRKQGRLSGGALMSFEVMNLVFGLGQGVWDIRSLVSWLEREHGGRRFGLYGISLGAYTAALTAGIDERFDTIVAGIPTSDFPRLFDIHMSGAARRRAPAADAAFREAVAEVFRVVSPLTVEPQVPRDRRFIFAAVGDRMAGPEQAVELWKHWDRPTIEWFNAAHAGSLATNERERFVLEALFHDATGV